MSKTTAHDVDVVMNAMLSKYLFSSNCFQFSGPLLCTASVKGVPAFTHPWMPQEARAT